MATFSRRSITTVRSEFAVPAADPYGAAAAEIAKAWAVAEREYRQTFGIGDDEALPDNAINFHPGDDEIVLSFEQQTAP